MLDDCRCTVVVICICEEHRNLQYDLSMSFTEHDIESGS